MGAPNVAGYFDSASAEPLHPAARDAFLTAIDEGWADPSRLYSSARRVRMMLDNAREVVADLIGARGEEVSFTSSGTQAVHLGLLGTYIGRRGKNRVVTSAVEHSCVLAAAQWLSHHHDADIQHVGVDAFGQVSAEVFSSTVQPDTAVACLQAANHEVGTHQPADEVARACSHHGVPLLVDAAQIMGRHDIPAGWSVLTASAHKWGGLAGVGILAVRRGVRWRSPLPDDERENHRVPGFENVPAILASVAALGARVEHEQEISARQFDLIHHIRQRLPQLIPDVEIVGHPTDRVAHIVTFSCLYVDGEALVTELDRAGFAVSSGSSCTASALRPSHVLEAMGALTHGNIRVSLTPTTSHNDVEAFLTALTDIVSRLRRDTEGL